MIKVLIIFLFFMNSLAQLIAPHGDYMANYHIPLEKRFKQKAQKNFFSQDKTSQLSASRSFLYSLVLPGAGQYMNGDKVRSYVYIAAEILGWTLYSSFTSDGDNQTKVVEAYVNNTETGFDRIRFYRNLYEAKHGSASAPAALQGSDVNGAFSALKSNSDLYAELRALENELGDGVHSLPETKTQQYYEMVGKYYMFFHGWKHADLADIKVGDTSDSSARPKHILNYFSERDLMNKAYKKATWAISGVIINHIVSSIEAYISQKRRLKVNYKSSFYNSEFVPTLKATYDF